MRVQVGPLIELSCLYDVWTVHNQVLSTFRAAMVRKGSTYIRHATRVNFLARLRPRNF